MVITNGMVTIRAATGYGPRILEYSRVGGYNVLGEAPDATIDTELGTWRAYGGHRLWFAPEIRPRTYVPDNDAVEVERLGPLAARIVAPIEGPTGIQKAMTIALDEEGTGASIIHRITNHSLWDLELAPWALTIVAPGGEAIIPNEPWRPHAESLLPVRTLALWSYTDLADPRVRFSERGIHIRSDGARTSPIKIGAANAQRWAGWHRDGTLFTKRFGFVDGALYPDMGCNTEVYTAGDFMELESLGPIVTLAPGESVEHLEQWELGEWRD
jgi:hypothetical protein